MPLQLAWSLGGKRGPLVQQGQLAQAMGVDVIATKLEQADSKQYVPGMLRTGVVEAGAAADLILLPADPRSNLEVLSTIQGVMVGGRWLDLRQRTPPQVPNDH